MRTSNIIHSSPESSDLHASYIWRGIASDLAVTLLLALICSQLTRIRCGRVAAYALCGIYCFMLAGNAEFIFANGANLDAMMFNQALDATFIHGAVLTTSFFWQLLQAAGVFLIAFYGLMAFRIPPLKAAFFWMSTAAAVVFLGVSPVRPTFSTWIQMNAVEENVANLRYIVSNDYAEALEHTGLPSHFIERFFQKNLNAKAIVASPREKLNVLMVVMESVGQQHVDNMPFLNKLTKSSLYYPNFVVTSHVTVNGLYSLLCADTPGFMIPSVGNVKVWQLPEKGENFFCLPQLLGHMGYQTVYMQSADLTFQRKHIFLPRSGFTQVVGKKDLDSEDNSAWGANDRQLYQHALAKIDEMEEKDQPWFMTVLTISTHYPPNIPEDFYVMKDGKRVEQAHLYADLSLEFLIKELESRELLEKTLIIITNDEVRGHGGSVGNSIDKNNGILFVLTPNRDRGVLTDTFLQTDMFLSVADYLGLNTEEIPMGWSIFREYGTFRPVFFNNFFLKQVFVYPTPGTILNCKGKGLECLTYKNDDMRLFNATWHGAPRLPQARWLIENISKKRDRKFPQLWQNTAISQSHK